MYILRVVIFSLNEPNLMRILTVFKENLVKYKGKRTSQEYTFILFLILTLKTLKKIPIFAFNCFTVLLYSFITVLLQWFLRSKKPL